MDFRIWILDFHPPARIGIGGSGEAGISWVIRRWGLRGEEFVGFSGYGVVMRQGIVGCEASVIAALSDFGGSLDSGALPAEPVGHLRSG